MGRRAKGLGLNVIAYDPYASAEKAAALGVQLVSFDDALATVSACRLGVPACLHGHCMIVWLLLEAALGGGSPSHEHAAAGGYSASSRGSPHSLRMPVANPLPHPLPPAFLPLPTRRPTSSRCTCP